MRLVCRNMIGGEVLSSGETVKAISHVFMDYDNKLKRALTLESNSGTIRQVRYNASSTIFVKEQ